jgi:hypothetical protein
MSSSQGSWFTLPNCQDALHLVETGIRRPLKLRERLALRYHQGLCLYCSCNRDKFDELYEQMKQSESRR